MLVASSRILERRRSSAVRAFPRDPLNIAPRDADISELTVIQAVQLTKTFVISPPDAKHSNQASDKIHGLSPLLCGGVRAELSFSQNENINHWP
jgi:hypothetical protein